MKLKVIPSPEPIAKPYQDIGVEMKRELSPALTIYKPQLTSIISISLRMTGFSLTLLSWLLGVSILLSDDKAEDQLKKIEESNLPNWLWNSLHCIVAIPVAFHICYGIRHIMFAAGKFLELKQIYMTGYAITAVAIGATVCLIKNEEIRDYLSPPPPPPPPLPPQPTKAGKSQKK